MGDDDGPVAITGTVPQKPVKIRHKFSLFNLRKKTSKAVISEIVVVAGNNASTATPRASGEESTGTTRDNVLPPISIPGTSLWAGDELHRIRIQPRRINPERHMSADSSSSSLSTDSGNPYQRDSYQSLWSQSSNDSTVPQDSAAVIPPTPARETPPPPYSIETQESLSQQPATQELQSTNSAPSTSSPIMGVDLERRYSFDASAPPDETIATSLLRDLPSPPRVEDIINRQKLLRKRLHTVISPIPPFLLQPGPHPFLESSRKGKQPLRPMPGSYPQSSSSAATSSSGNHLCEGHLPRRPYTPDNTSLLWLQNFYAAEADGLSLVDPFQAERVQRMEEEDRALAEQLQRLEDEESDATHRLHEIQAKEFNRLQESEELVRLEDLKRIAQEDELLAQALMAQEQAEYDQEQSERIEREEEERRERERRESLGVGAPVAVRRVNSWGKITEASINELTPEVVKHLKHVKETFAKSISEMKITKLEWIVNPRLETQFEHTRTQLKAAKHSTKELLLFHGTEAGNINKYLAPTC
jgi:hypothetical protein